MSDLSQSEAWKLLEEALKRQLDNASIALQNLDNEREIDLVLKAKINIIKELLKLPQVITLAANTKRNQ